MRPLRLDVEGFGTFRDAMTLDFSDTDYFALVGPTGSGKTTVIDAMCFALYGSAPRWPRRDQISLAMAPSESHTRVSLTFESGAQRYAAVRVLARAGTGRVHTKQARLVQLSSDAALDGTLGDLLDAEVTSLADSGDDMEDAVQRLLGLTWNHFTQCVVLPQGQFARFLHAAKRERQDLLVELLGLSVYGQVGQRANAAAKELGQRAQTLAAEMAKYSDATEEAESVATEREQTLSTLQTGLPQLLTKWLETERELSETSGAGTALTDLAARLTDIKAPAELDELTSQRTSALERLETAAGAVADAETVESAAETAATEAGEPGSWKALLDAHAHVSALGVKVEEAAATLAQASTALDKARAERDQTAQVQSNAEDLLEDARTASRADDLARRLVAGEECPVCLQTVATVPPRPAHPGIATAEKALKETQVATREAAHTANHAEASHSRAEHELQRLKEEIAEAQRRLEGKPDAATAKVAEESAVAAQKALDAARAAARSSRNEHRQADLAVKDLQGRWSDAGLRLATTRDQLADHRPPALTGDHAADWAAFTAWVAAKATEVSGQIAEHSARVEAAQAAAKEEREAIREQLLEHGVTAPDKLTEVGVTTAVANAVSNATHTLSRIQERRGEAAALATQVVEAEKAEKLNRSLGLLLSARNFERWMLEEALASMVLEASATLNELSNGQFELAVDEKQDILVIDHNDASTRRPVQTLSGGETFQASLALALALSSQIASLSSGGGRLDTILLDEGFGTLDGSTLDVVAATLEQLSGNGDRVVGLVTHVAALADRVPARFTVTREGSRSTVEKEWT